MNSLQPPPVGNHYVSLSSLINFVNKHAGEQGYAVVKVRTKTSKKGIVRKCVLKCDRGGQPRDNNATGKRNSGSRLTGCKFSAIAKLDDEGWFLTINNPDHNHEATLRGSHPALRKMAMTDEVKNTIATLSRAQAAPATILTHLRLDGDLKDPIFKSKDIYNARAAISRAALGPHTPVQALMRFLDDWYVKYEKDQDDQITRLFFTKACSQNILKANHEVLLMDCTYKTNKYRLPLLIVSGVTGLNSTFYVAFCFMTSELIDDYTWMLQQLAGLYDDLSLPRPIVIITDREKALIAALSRVYPGVQNLLCLWHIQKNVLKHCKPQFETDEGWSEFLQAFNTVVNASSRDAYETAYDALHEKYYITHTDAVAYIYEEWLDNYKKKFVKFWTNQTTHFNNITTSRSEGVYRTLKRSLRFPTGDLKTVVDTIDSLLSDQRKTYLINLHEAKSRISHRLRLPILINLHTRITPFALKQIYDQFLLITAVEGPLPACTNVFTTTTGLPCSHKIQQRMYDQEMGGLIQMEDIHTHWWFEKPEITNRVEDMNVDNDNVDGANPDAPLSPLPSSPPSPPPPSFPARSPFPPQSRPENSLLRVREPRVLRGKGSPQGSMGKRKEIEFERSSQRELSYFERVEQALDQGHAQEQPVRRGRGIPRGSGKKSRGRRGAGRGRTNEVRDDQANVRNDGFRNVFQGDFEA